MNIWRKNSLEFIGTQWNFFFFGNLIDQNFLFWWTLQLWCHWLNFIFKTVLPSNSTWIFTFVLQYFSSNIYLMNLLPTTQKNYKFCPWFVIASCRKWISAGNFWSVLNKIWYLIGQFLIKRENIGWCVYVGGCLKSYINIQGCKKIKKFCVSFT